MKFLTDIIGNQSLTDGVNRVGVNDDGSLNVVVISGGGGGGGDASAANQVIGNASLASIDSKTPELDTNGFVPVSLTACPLPTGAATSALQATGNTKLDSIIAALVSVPVTGTFWQTTQPVSAASLPLPSGAATAAKQDTGNTSLASIVTALASVPVTGTFWQTTQPVSLASQPLPTGASTAAKQPALGTAGSASADVISIQGVTSMTPVKVDGSGVTQPVSGTVTANAGTNLNTSALALDATLTGGTQKTKLVDSAGTNVATISSGGALKVDGSAVTQPVSIATAPVLVAGSAIIGKVGIDQTTPGTTNGVQDISDGPVSAGTAATKSSLAGAVYNSSLLTPTNGQQFAMQADANGRLRMNDSGTVSIQTVSNPAAGAAWSYTVPAGTVQRIISLRFALTCSATIATRDTQLQAGSSGNVFVVRYASTLAAAGVGQFSGIAGVVVADATDTFSVKFIYAPLPPEFILPAGATVSVFTENLQTGDQFSNIALLVESWSS